MNNFSKHSGRTITQEYKDLRGNPFSLKGKTRGQIPNNFTISNRDYNTYRYNLSKEKLSFSFHSLLSFSFLFSLTLSIFLFSFACSHSSNSSRLHQSSISLVGTSLFTAASHPHPLGSSLLQPIFTGRMASLFVSSSFPSFLPFTLFISSHNKCEPLTLTLLQPKSLSSGLIGRMALLVSFLSSFTSVSQV